MYDMLILAHALDSITPQGNYTINQLARLFSEAGLKVGYQIGLANRQEARVILNHVDLTVTPPDYVDFLQSYPLALNGSLTDISKHVVCDGTLVTLGDGYRGPVIVKTKLNCGGLQESRKSLLPKRRELRPGVDEIYTWRTVPIIDPQAYPVLENTDPITADVWANPHLVVQRLVTEQDEQGRYCLRSWYVFGDRGFHVITMALNPIVRGRNIIDRKVVEMELPPRLKAMQAEMKVDFGRFDYVLSNGDAVVFDVNRTPTSTPGAVEHYQSQWREMALGIKRYLD
jgi:hypothetical protein